MTRANGGDEMTTKDEVYNVGQLWAAQLYIVLHRSQLTRKEQAQVNRKYKHMLNHLDDEAREFLVAATLRHLDDEARKLLVGATTEHAG